MRHVKTVNEVIDSLGGTTAVARLSGRGLTAVSNWRMREKLPAESFVILTAALGELGLSAPPSLWGMDEPLRQRADAADCSPRAPV